MKLHEIMNEPVETADAEDTLAHAAQSMRDGHVGVLPVYEGRVLVGMITDRDIVVRAIAAGRDPRTTKVEEAMTWGVETCREDADLEDAVRAMEQRKVRRLAVLNKDGVLVGILSLSDIATKAHDAQTVEEVLEAVSGYATDPGAGTYDVEE